MADDFKALRDNLFRAISGKSLLDRLSEDDTGPGSLGIDASAAKALIATLFARAGKGKDEVVQILAREIGVAVAAMMKEPLAQLAKHQKLQISFEFVPKQGHEQGPKAAAAEPMPEPAPRSRAAKRPRKKSERRTDS